MLKNHQVLAQYLRYIGIDSDFLHLTYHKPLVFSYQNELDISLSFEHDQIMFFYYLPLPKVATRFWADILAHLSFPETTLPSIQGSAEDEGLVIWSREWITHVDQAKFLDWLLYFCNTLKHALKKFTQHQESRQQYRAILQEFK